MADTTKTPATKTPTKRGKQFYVLYQQDQDGKFTDVVAFGDKDKMLDQLANLKGYSYTPVTPGQHLSDAVK